MNFWLRPRKQVPVYVTVPYMISDCGSKSASTNGRSTRFVRDVPAEIPTPVKSPWNVAILGGDMIECVGTVLNSKLILTPTLCV